MRGLVVGKFYPPHNGHHLLIDTANELSDSLDVLIVNSPTYHISAEVRKGWLEKRHPYPDVTFHIIEDIHDEDNSEAWAAHTIDFLGYSPDTVFSSEDYGHNYAQFLGAKHHMVDRARKKIPVSGSQIRKNLYQNWDFLDCATKADLVIRIVIVGAESTGTTTLSKELAKQYKTAWVPEVGRFYAEAIESRNSAWSDTDFKSIAYTQQILENEIAENSHGLIFCDTNATATTLWQKRYLGHCTKEVERIAERDKVDLYIITDCDIPFVQDGTRDGEHIRKDMHRWFVDKISRCPSPFIIVSGTVEDRLRQSATHIDAIIERKSRIGN